MVSKDGWWFTRIAISISMGGIGRPEVAQSRLLECEKRHENLSIEFHGRALRWEEIAAGRGAMVVSPLIWLLIWRGY
jgi:hypothetical protein